MNNDYHRAWRAKNADKVRAAAAKYREKNRELMLQRTAEWRAKNPEYKQRANELKRAAYNPDRNAQQTKQWRERNAERSRQICREWRKSNPGEVARLNTQRRVRHARQTPVWANDEIIGTLYAVAAIYREAGIPAEVDHILPIAGKKVSGFHCEQNLRIVPKHINRSKFNKYDGD